MKKGVSLLELLFVVFLVLSLMEVRPFGDWAWWKILGPLVVDWVVRVLKLAWTNYGLDKLLYSEIESARYELRLKREVQRAKKQIEKNQF